MKTKLIILFITILCSNVYSQNILESESEMVANKKELEKQNVELNKQLSDCKEFNYSLDEIIVAYNNIKELELLKIINNNIKNINLPDYNEDFLIYSSYNSKPNLELKFLKKDLKSLLNENAIIANNSILFLNVDESQKNKKQKSDDEKNLELKELEKKLEKIKIGLSEIKIRSTKIPKIIENKINSNDELILDLSRKIIKKRTSINTIAVKWGLPAFCITILLLFLVPAYLNQKKENQNRQINQQYLLDVSTVLLLTLSILILGLSDKIDSAVLGTLLGGISGYVLNRTSKRNYTSTEKKEVENNETKE